MVWERQSVEAWWRSPVASILLVIVGIGVVVYEVGLGDDATAYGYSAGIALVGLGVTGRIQTWAVKGGGQDDKPSS